MAKGSDRRAAVERLQSKWGLILKHQDPDRDTSCLSFGRIFSRDPIDCGSPNCLLCSYDKVLHRKSRRALSRAEERQGKIEFLEEDTEEDETASN